MKIGARCFAPLILLAFLAPESRAGAIEQFSCAVTSISPPARHLDVSCRMSPREDVEIVFRDSFAGVTGLSARILSLEARAALGERLMLEALAPGRYRLRAGREQLPVTLSYRVNLSTALDPGQYALVSSLGPDAAVLYPADLFPSIESSGLSSGEPLAERPSIEIKSPADWRVAAGGGSSAAGGGNGEDASAEREAYVLGRLRERALEVGGLRLRLAIAGSWPFADEEIARLAETIARAQAAMIGSEARGDHLLALAPFPLPLTGLRSTGLARGRTVALLLNPGNDASETLRHLSRHLAHEMFHFYLPNAFRIRENFDWFWEGFTRYLALTTLVEARLVALPDYLDALQAEYDAYTANPLRAKLSLVAASPEKFATPAHYEIVYRKGMLVAALYDLELRWQSRARSRLSDIVRGLYRDFALRGREIGNREVISELGRAGNFTSFVADYIEGVREIDLVRALKPYGIEVDRRAARGRARLIVSSGLNARQRELIASLGGRQ